MSTSADIPGLGYKALEHGHTNENEPSKPELQVLEWKGCGESHCMCTKRRCIQRRLALCVLLQAQSRGIGLGQAYAVCERADVCMSAKQAAIHKHFITGFRIYLSVSTSIHTVS